MSYLDGLLSATHERVGLAKRTIPAADLAERARAADAARGFARALAERPMSIIAEIKRATPSLGALDLDLDARALAHAYAAGGAAALSVLTEPHHFKGSLDDLPAARAAGLPVLRKDFIVDPYQLVEARAFGADAVLLIARVVRDGLKALMDEASRLGMDAFVEVYDEEDLDAALGAGARAVGVNHRDLETFEVDPDRTAKLAPLVPSDVVLVGLSGVSTRADVVELQRAGARAVLVGESLVRAADPTAKLRELRGAA